ncbi:MAG: hypothetical protein AAF382_02865 [Pseudomonadota bacterium]
MFRAVLLVFCFACNTGASAATLEVVGPLQTDPGQGCSLQFSGAIGPGTAKDAETVLRELIKPIFNYPSHLREEQVVLCLSSTGGNFLEGLRLARLFQKLDLTTRVNPGDTCLSACAVAFMGGRLNSRSGEGYYSSRYLHPTSKLGFHAPSLDLQGEVFDRDSVAQAYSVALLSISFLAESANQLKLSPRLLREMLRNSGRDFFFVETLDDLADHDIQLYGYQAPPNTQSARFSACANAFRWHFTPDEDRETLANFDVSHFSEREGTVSFVPFDGEMYCQLQTIELGAGWMDLVVQSELPSLTDPSLKLSYPSWVRLPGPTHFLDLVLGQERDAF